MGDAVGLLVWAEAECSSASNATVHVRMTVVDPSTVQNLVKLELYVIQVGGVNPSSKKEGLRP